MAEEVGAKERALDFSDEERPGELLVAKGELDIACAVALDGGTVRGSELTGRGVEAPPLVRRCGDDADLSAGVDEVPAFGEGVIDKEELVDAGRS